MRGLLALKLNHNKSIWRAVGRQILSESERKVVVVVVVVVVDLVDRTVVVESLPGRVVCCSQCGLFDC